MLKVRIPHVIYDCGDFNPKGRDVEFEFCKTFRSDWNAGETEEGSKSHVSSCLSFRKINYLYC